MRQRTSADEAAINAGHAPTPERVRLRIGGTVQGVGFRPYVYRLAQSLALTGFVRNDATGVLVEVEGGAASVACFVARLPAEAPPLVACDWIMRETLAPHGGAEFTILESDAAARVGGTALVAPDVATCDDCLRELLDPSDRRYRYPFVNCTNCGPRFTIIRGVPYDRPLTTMDAFTMCCRCAREYADPADRRFHAQPNACPECGPTARFVDSDGAPITTRSGRDAIAELALALLAGAIVGVKGIGGYHIACVASDERTVMRLRERKRRPDKPLALMAADLEWASCLVTLDAAERALLTGRERPIVLARRRTDAPIADAVAPRQRDFGVMLPYSPLHHLLLRDVGEPLVMTSGNLTDEPIAYRDDDARERLRGIVDAFLVHDRPIETPTDDSVVRVVSAGGDRRLMMVRRSRGYAPTPMMLPIAAREPVLACGAQLKNTYGLAMGDRAWIGPHVGDLERYETLQAFTAGTAHHERLFSVSPVRIAHDLHPEYLSTKYALERAAQSDGMVTEAVQHHHAHFAAALAEHGETGRAIGVIFDGTGYGDTGGANGALWGGEILIGDLVSAKRAASLDPVRMPGGEAAIREPWRMACAWLTALSPGGEPPLPAALAGAVDVTTWRSVARLARSGIASPWTSSAGRLFDAIAALCGVCPRVSYEGQAAIELEAAADPNEHRRYPMSLHSAGGDWPERINMSDLISCVVDDVARGVPIETISALAHNGMAYAAAFWCEMLGERHGLRTVVLSGGVFQNALLVERTVEELTGRHFRVLLPERLPVNDGGIAYGQLAVAAARASIESQSC